MPKVVEEDPRQHPQHQHDQRSGLMDRLYRNGRDVAGGLVPVAFLAALWMHARLGGLV